MFKKAINIIDDEKMTPKDRKTFKADLQKNFDLDSVNHVFFNVNDFHKLKAEKSKMIIYSDGTDPLFVDSTSKKDYFPTVYALSMFPKLLKASLVLKDGAEANLNKTGQLKSNSVSNIGQLENCSADDVISIVKADGEIFAIGALAIGSDDLKKNENKEELAAYILHFVGDHLYQVGSSKLKPIIYNGPDKKQNDEEDDKEEEEDENEDEDDMMAFANLDKGKKTTTGKKGGPNKFSTTKVATSTKTQPTKKDQKVTKAEKTDNKAKDDDFDDDKKGGKKQKKKGPQKTHDEEGDAKKDKGQTSNKNMDKCIKEAFLNCLILTVDDKNLPMDNMVMWKDHIVPCKDPEIELDIKSSGYKTLGKFFQTMDKEGFIVYKEAGKKSSTPQITEVIRSNDILSEWEPTVSEAATKRDKDADDKKEVVKIEVTKTVKNMCKPKELLKKYMENPPEDYIEHKYFIKKVEEHLKTKNLLKKKEVTIDEDLQKDFGLEDEESEEEEEDNKKDKEDKKKKAGPKLTIEFDKLITLMDKNISYVHKIIDKKTGVEVVKDAKFPGVGIFAEKAHGKFITRVSHLGELGVDLDKLLTEWEKRFSTTGSVHETAEGKHKVKEIVLQGTWFDQVKDYLTMDLKLSEDMLSAVNKLEKKKKKK